MAKRDIVGSEEISEWTVGGMFAVLGVFFSVAIPPVTAMSGFFLFIVAEVIMFLGLYYKSKSVKLTTIRLLGATIVVVGITIIVGVVLGKSLTNFFGSELIVGVIAGLSGALLVDLLRK